MTDDGDARAAGRRARSACSASAARSRSATTRTPRRPPRRSARSAGRRYSIPGDYATVDPDGTIRLLGRGSACINTGGEKVYPEEVELALRAHPDVFDCVVVGVPDDRWGEMVVALVEPRDGRPIDADALAAHCRATLAGYKVPKRFVAVDSLATLAGRQGRLQAAARARRRATEYRSRCDEHVAGTTIPEVERRRRESGRAEHTCCSTCATPTSGRRATRRTREWVPLGELEGARFQLPINRRIVCVCRSGARSARADRASSSQMGLRRGEHGGRDEGLGRGRACRSCATTARPAKSSDRRPSASAGGMFWLWRKRFVGSHCLLEARQPREFLGAERRLDPAAALVADEVEVHPAASSTASSRAAKSRV